jgi:hypothetical protein
MSEWILLHNTAVRQADVCNTVTLQTGERLSVRESQAGGKWLYLRLKGAAKQVAAEEEYD